MGAGIHELPEVVANAPRPTMMGAGIHELPEVVVNAPRIPLPDLNMVEATKPGMRGGKPRYGVQTWGSMAGYMEHPPGFGLIPKGFVGGTPESHPWGMPDAPDIPQPQPQMQLPGPIAGPAQMMPDTAMGTPALTAPPMLAPPLNDGQVVPNRGKKKNGIAPMSPVEMLIMIKRAENISKTRQPIMGLR